MEDVCKDVECKQARKLRLQGAQFCTHTQAITQAITGGMWLTKVRSLKLSSHAAQACKRHHAPH